MSKTVTYGSILLKSNPPFQCLCTAISYHLIRGTSNISCYCYEDKTAMPVSCICFFSRTVNRQLRLTVVL